MNENSLIRLQSKRVDAHRQRDSYFRERVQLEEQIKDLQEKREFNDIRLHFMTGYIRALDDLEGVLVEDMSGENKAERPDSAMNVSGDLPPMGGSIFPEEDYK